MKKIILIILYLIILFISLHFINGDIRVIKDTSELVAINVMPETSLLLDLLSIAIYPSILIIFTITILPSFKNYRTIMKGVLFFSVIVRYVPFCFSLYINGFSLSAFLSSTLYYPVILLLGAIFKKNYEKFAGIVAIIGIIISFWDLRMKLLHVHNDVFYVLGMYFPYLLHSFAIGLLLCLHPILTESIYNKYYCLKILQKKSFEFFVFSQKMRIMGYVAYLFPELIFYLLLSPLRVEKIATLIFIISVILMVFTDTYREGIKALMAFTLQCEIGICSRSYELSCLSLYRPVSPYVVVKDRRSLLFYNMFTFIGEWVSNSEMKLSGSFPMR